MLLGVLAPAEPLKGRSVETLNGPWLFREQPSANASAADWMRAPAPDARTTNVPSLWTCSTAPGYHGTAWYWRSFEVPSQWKDQNVRLFFHGIAGEATCYLNGALLGTVPGPYGVAQFDVTRVVKRQEANLLAVRVDASKGSLEEGAGGIWQTVELVASDEAHLTSVRVVAEASGWVTVRADVENTSQKTGDAEMRLDVLEAGQNKVVANTVQHVEVSPGRNRTELLLHVNKPHLWSPDAPYLYTARVSFTQGRDVLDNVDRQFGFREVRSEAGRILINGTPVDVRWASVTAPIGASQPPPCSAEDEGKTLQQMHAKGIGGLWVEHGALSGPALLAADREGMLIAEGAGFGMTAEDMATRYGSHPSIVIWRAGGQKDADAFRAVDGTRPVLAALPVQHP